MGHDQWKATRRGRRGGLRTGRFHEGKNFCRSVRTGGRKVQGHAQSVDMSTSVPISLEQAFFAASGSGDCVPAHSARLQAHANGSALGTQASATSEWRCREGQTVTFQAPVIRNAIPKNFKHLGHPTNATHGSGHVISQQGRTRDRKMKRQKKRNANTEMQYEEQTMLALAYQAFSSMQFREMGSSARGGDPWACRARRCAAAVKSEVVVEVSEGQGQVARACEAGGLTAKTWQEVAVENGRARDECSFAKQYAFGVGQRLGKLKGKIAPLAKIIHEFCREF